LLLEVQYRTQSKLHGFTFGFQASYPERLFHQLIVDHNIGSHDV
jgi:hypothetical protein